MANKSNLRTYLGISMFFLAVAGFAQARTITVGPGAAYDFDSIQAGIDAANDADTVLVAYGEYVITEPITFRGKAITVKSEAGPDETTIRMGTPTDTNRTSVVVFENNETAASVLDGFMIAGGTGYWMSSENKWLGGGIFFDASSATVSNCAIVQNSAKHGGGVFCAYQSTPRLIDCIIAENSSATSSGGGVFAWSGVYLTLTNCIVRGNSAGSSGGGVVCTYDSSMTMTGCIISGNSATADSGGGVMCWDKSSATLTYCTIV